MRLQASRRPLSLGVSVTCLSHPSSRLLIVRLRSRRKRKILYAFEEYIIRPSSTDPTFTILRFSLVASPFPGSLLQTAVMMRIHYALVPFLFLLSGALAAPPLGLGSCSYTICRAGCSAIVTACYCSGGFPLRTAVRAGTRAFSTPQSMEYQTCHNICVYALLRSAGIDAEQPTVFSP